MQHCTSSRWLRVAAVAVLACSLALAAEPKLPTHAKSSDALFASKQNAGKPKSKAVTSDAELPQSKFTSRTPTEEVSGCVLFVLRPCVRRGVN
jgi:hypothetical protein